MINDWPGVEVPRDIYASCWGRIRASVIFFRQCTRFKMCSLMTASSCFPFPTSHKYLSFQGVRESGRGGEDKMLSLRLQVTAAPRVSSVWECVSGAIKSVGQRRLPVNEKEYTTFIIVDNAWVERRWLVVVVGVLWAVVGLWPPSSMGATCLLGALSKTF